MSSGVSLADTSTSQMQILVQDIQGKPVEDARVWFYEYESGKPSLRDEGITDSMGCLVMTVASSTIESSSQAQYRDFALHVFHPEQGLLVRNWTHDTTLKTETTYDHNVVINYETTSIEKTSIKSQGSGYFRTVLVDTIPTIQAVKIGEMYHVPGLQVLATFESNMSTSIQTKMKTVFPFVGSWSLTGSLTRNTNSASGTQWSSQAIAYGYHGMGLLTRFHFNQEVWELQEQDVDIYDLWHTREQWIEVKQNGHYGGLINGNSFYSMYNCKPYNEVVADLWGPHKPIGAYGKIWTESSGGQAYESGVSFGISFPYGFAGEFSADTTTVYNQKLKFEHYNPSSSLAAIYPMFTGGSVWYATKE